MKHLIIILALFCCFSVAAQPRIIGANVTTILAGEAIPNWSLVYIRGGVAFKAENTVIGNVATGIAIDTALASGDTIQVAFSGTLQGFAVVKGAEINLGASGVLTTAKPTTGFYQKIGQWVADSSIQLSIEPPLPVADIITGVSSQTVTAATTITVTIPTQADNTYSVFITPKNLISSVLYYIADSGKTTTSFDITVLSAITGLVAFDWEIIQQ